MPDDNLERISVSAKEAAAMLRTAPWTVYALLVQQSIRVQVHRPATARHPGVTQGVRRQPPEAPIAWSA